MTSSEQHTRARSRFLPSDKNFDEEADVGISSSSSGDDADGHSARKSARVAASSSRAPARARASPGRSARRELDATAYASIGVAAALGADATFDRNAHLVLDLERRNYSPGRPQAGRYDDPKTRQRLQQLLAREAEITNGTVGTDPSRSVTRDRKKPAQTTRHAQAKATASFHGVSLHDRDCRNPNDQLSDTGTSSDDSTETPAARRRRHEARAKQRQAQEDAAARSRVESRAASMGLFNALLSRPRTLGAGASVSPTRHANPLAALESERSPPRFIAEEFDGDVHGVRLSKQSEIAQLLRTSPEPAQPWSASERQSKVFAAPPQAKPGQALREALERPALAFAGIPGATLFGVGPSAQVSGSQQTAERSRDKKKKRSKATLADDSTATCSTRFAAESGDDDTIAG
eukprot:CAMPEP_0174841166 /NCGR_PEP_ID=MMETSP1114-20130205/9132_1 /TAXON_ID=312471 /ORGANISM="Neobodo designis, Strain CCAP 1951/1" /LENGTH=405 /DNA_ID=CAMNT_0016075345 /DNA_START=49 /DNA_END=1263 /DNA_ORIENTATION=+